MKSAALLRKYWQICPNGSACRNPRRNMYGRAWTALLDGEEAGFIVQKQTSDAAVEICVMGVKKRYHRQGIGARLWQAFASDARKKGFSYAQVKTVAAGRYLEYDCTRAFYERMGFQALEVFPTLWDAWNPCLLMVQKL